MVKPLADRIAARLGPATGAGRGVQRAAFLAQKNEIAQALAAGWSVKDIWRTLSDEGRIRVGYQAFCEYVNRWIREPVVPPAPSVAPNPSAGYRPDGHSRPKPTTGFTLNPQPKKEDLV
ncbi:TraK family protein [Methylolobus aquaticus]